jgi:hypothetical protein
MIKDRALQANLCKHPLKSLGRWFDKTIRVMRQNRNSYANTPSALVQLASAGNRFSSELMTASSSSTARAWPGFSESAPCA